MYTFRFNPLFERWVLVGNAVVQPTVISAAHLLDAGKSAQFVAASYPRQPFIVEPPAVSPPSEHGLYVNQPAVGEYEVLLYSGDQPFACWEAKVWREWLTLLQKRLLQFHFNPYLHYVSFQLPTRGLDSIKDYQRVGELIATSHPICEDLPELTAHLAQKLLASRSIFTIAHPEGGYLHIPAAPLYEQEIWYIPADQQSGLQEMDKEQRRVVAEALASVMTALQSEYPKNHYVIKIATKLATANHQTRWWLQIHKEEGEASPLPVRPLPEIFLKKLTMLLTEVRK